MTLEESRELHNAVEAVATQDVHLGRVLHLIVSHLPGFNLMPPQPTEEEKETPAEKAAEEPST